MRMIDADELIVMEYGGIKFVPKEFVDDAPTIRWIPVTERLPEKTGKYLVTVSNGNVYAGTYSAYERKFSCAATAWMPLPEPYKGDEPCKK